MADPTLPADTRAPWRDAAWAALGREAFDVLVIGGGINGAGIARDAAMRGLRVALIEQADFASGTSSRSTKLIHGGLRYLEQGRVRLVLESVRERERLRRLAPHLVRPMRFVVPLYRGRTVGKLTLTAGLWAYDLLAGLWSVKRHRMLSARRTLALEPGLRTEGLVGAGEYWDCWTNDARLVLETLLSAVEHGVVAVSYAVVTSLLRDGTRTAGARVRDRVTGAEVAVRARVVVNATGPWADHVLRLDEPDAPARLRLTKGAHVVVPRSRIRHEAAIVLNALRDGRVMFIIPWDAHAVIGTTDTDHVGGADSPPVVEADDVTYLLETVNHYFPAAHLTPADVVGGFAGLRPLVAPPPGMAMSASAVSREEEIVESRSGLISIIGGKLTTYRIIASHVVDHVVGALRRSGDQRTIPKSQTGRAPFPGGTTLPEDVAAALVSRNGHGVARDVLAHLAGRYGGRAAALVDAVAGDHTLGDAVLAPLPDPRVEILGAVDREMALTLEDVLRRRTQLELFDAAGTARSAPEVAGVMAERLGWPADAARTAAVTYAERIAADIARWR